MFLSLAVGMLMTCNTTNLISVESGPKVGSTVAELKFAVMIGTAEGSDDVITKERKDQPTAYLFVRSETFDRPIFRYMKTLDQKLNDLDSQWHVVAVWIGEAADKDKEFLNRARKSLEFRSATIGVFTGGKAGPDVWAINPDAHLTTVIVNKDKVQATFAYTSVNETDVAKVIEAAKKATKK